MPPLKIMCVSSFPDVLKIATLPCFVVPKNTCWYCADFRASTAGLNSPKVEFLTPTGHDSPEVSSL